jgi:hypothetical protein
VSAQGPQAGAHLAWTGGGEARVTSFGDRGIVLRSSRSSPPGSRIEGALAGEPPAKLRVKIHACRRADDGSFVLEGRPIDMTREVRARVEALAAALPVERAPEGRRDGDSAAPGAADGDQEEHESEDR